MTELATLAVQIGVVAAIALYSTWTNWQREQSTNKRLRQLEDRSFAMSVSLVERTTAALERHAHSIDQLANAIHELVDDANLNGPSPRA